MKKIILFDMDGTLTPPRKKMNCEIVNYLTALQKNGFEIGILSGSDLDYILEQCAILFDAPTIDWRTIHYLPCNGTKYFRAKEDHLDEVYSLDMRNHIGRNRYNSIIKVLLNHQSEIRYEGYGKEFPFSGTFIQYRGSMINWCPIGRDADDSDREYWISIDKQYSIRHMLLLRLLSNPCFSEITVKLGGETSFDIYPNGWDKTYAWINFENYSKIYFIGDRCKLDGNDYEAFVKAGSQGFETTGPEETIQIIKNILENELH